MAAGYSICLGTAGWGVWHSPDAGKSWIRHRALMVAIKNEDVTKTLLAARLRTS
jgi:hypothetical protein